MSVIIRMKFRVLGFQSVPQPAILTTYQEVRLHARIGYFSSLLITPPLSRDEDTRLARAERAARKGGEAQICAAQACGTQMRFATHS